MSASLPACIRPLLFLSALILSLMPAFSQTPDTYRWTNRLILIFTPAADDPQTQQQFALLEPQRSTGLPERDLKIIVLPSPQSENPPQATLEVWRKTFSVTSDAFTVLLIGKDGTEKFRSLMPVAPEKLFAIIDAMPMRQSEMRRQNP
ncbi:MAG: DUF4174 domain-containing protein [Bacteroidetes bacterium]|nr:MAG: DUF4174 domain-containing protein [Bacteroidota bacterium]